MLETVMQNEIQPPAALPSDEIRDAALSFAAYFSFIRWAEKYGYDLRDTPRNTQGISDRYPSFLGLSAPLSASFNLGYDPADQSVYIAVEEEEFEWLPWLAIDEVVIGDGLIYILTRPVQLMGGNELPPVALQFCTNQSKVWHAFPNARVIGFMHIRCDDEGYSVQEIASARFPIRYLQ